MIYRKRLLFEKMYACENCPILSFRKDAGPLRSRKAAALRLYLSFRKKVPTATTGWRQQPWALCPERPKA